MPKRPTSAESGLTAHERRILTYLDQRGETDRYRLVTDLASPDSRAGRGYVNGSNGAIPMISANWCRRLVREGLVAERYEAVEYTSRGQRRSFSRHAGYSVTASGRHVVRGGGNA